jgi:hypothetical protein
MITTFKSTKTVLVNPMTLLEDYVFLDIQTVEQNGLAYYGQVNFYYMVEGNPIQLQSVNPVFTNAEFDYFAQGVQEDTFTKTFEAVVNKITLYSLEQGKYFGLTAKYWEIYVAPTPEPLPEPLPVTPSEDGQ